MSLKSFPLPETFRKNLVRLRRLQGMHMKKVLIALSIIIVTIGQWNSARDMVERVYAGVVTHFTDHLEQQQLSHLRIHTNIAYIESVLGHARLIKPSRLDPNQSYRYYFNPKYLATLAVQNDRVTAIQIITLNPDFPAKIPFSQHSLNQLALAQLQEQPSVFSSDNFNSQHYLEHRKLGREGMLLDLYLGYVNYQKDAPPLLSQQLASLNEAQLLSDQAATQQQVQQLRLQLQPNFFTLGNLTMRQAEEMLLSRYEFTSYFYAL